MSGVAPTVCPVTFGQSSAHDVDARQVWSVECWLALRVMLDSVYFDRWIYQCTALPSVDANINSGPVFIISWFIVLFFLLLARRVA